MTDTLNLTNALGIIRKKLRLISLVTLIVFGWGLLYVATMYTPKYESKARLWIKQINQIPLVAQMYDPNSNPLAPVAQAGNPILTQMEILKSTQTSKELTQFINTHYPEENPTGKLIDINDYMDLKNKVGTDIIEVHFNWSKPELAQLFLKKALETYQATVTETNKGIRRKRREIIDHKIVEIEKDLADVNQKIKTYKQANRIMTLPIEGEELARRRGDTEALLAKVTMEKQGALNKANELARQLGLSGTQGLKNTVISYENVSLLQLEQSLSTSMLDYLEKREILSDENPKLIALKNKVDYLKKQIQDLHGIYVNESLKNNPLTISDPVKSGMAEEMAASQGEYIALRAQENSLRGVLSRIGAQYKQLPENEYSLNHLMEMKFVLTEAYKSLKTQQIDAHLNEAEVMSNIFEVDTPTFEEEPVPLTQLHYLILSLLAGGALGLFVAILQQQLEDVCEQANEVENITGKPVVGRLPWVRDLPPSTGLPSFNPAYNNIVSNLRVQSADKRLQTLVFTSPLSDTAREYSFVYGIANQLASLNYRVALVDNDFRNPTFLSQLTQPFSHSATLSDALYAIEKHSYNGNGNGNGASKNGKKTLTAVGVLEAVSSNGQALAEAVYSNGNGNGNGTASFRVESYAHKVSDSLHVFGNMNSLEDPYKYFNSQAYNTFIEKLKAEYDWVIVDAPIDYSAPEFPIIARLSDGVMLMVNYQIKKAKLKEIMSLLQEWDVNFLGSVVREEGVLESVRI